MLTEMRSLFVWAGMIAAVGLCCTMYSFLFITENVINLWAHNHSPQGRFGWILYLCSTHSPLSENMNVMHSWVDCQSKQSAECFGQLCVLNIKYKHYWNYKLSRTGQDRLRPCIQCPDLSSSFPWPTSRTIPGAMWCGVSSPDLVYSHNVLL